MPLLSKGDYKGVLSSANRKAGVSQIITSGLERIEHTQRREEIEYAMEEQVLQLMLKLEKIHGVVCGVVFMMELWA